MTSYSDLSELGARGGTKSAITSNTEEKAERKKDVKLSEQRGGNGPEFWVHREN